MARPEKLDEELAKRIISCIRAGNYLETAAAYGGISKDTLYRWLRQGSRAKGGIYREFSDAAEKAMAEAEVRDVAIIAKAAEDQWQAAAWRLERKYPGRWGRKDKLSAELTGRDGGPIELDAKAALAAKLDAMSKRMSESSCESDN